MRHDDDALLLDTYWVRPGRLLAGEYPGARESADAAAKVRGLIAAGVTAFVDLTEDGELLPYAHLLPPMVEHRRMPIRDVNVPTVPEMVRILDRLDEQLAAGHVVYVHCWGGVGRTGTVIGCFLARHGLSGVEALEEVRRLRRPSRKAWRDAPETREQRAMVRDWPMGQ